jgi:hypothetical protein
VGEILHNSCSRLKAHAGTGFIAQSSARQREIIAELERDGHEPTTANKHRRCIERTGKEYSGSLAKRVVGQFK